MKKRPLSLLLCLVALCATIALAHAVESRMPYVICADCGIDVEMEVVGTYITTEEKPCKHGSPYGYDVYEVLMGELYGACPSCGEAFYDTIKLSSEMVYCPEPL